MTSWFTIARIVPEYLSLNGSAANAEIIAASLRALGHDVTVIDVNDPSHAVSSVDLVCIGSGSGSSLRPAATALIGLVRIMTQWRNSGAQIFAHGMGWDLLGTHIVLADGEKLPGCGLFPSSADLRVPRFAGEVSGIDYQGRESAGYVNHVGRSTLEEGTQALCSIELSSDETIRNDGLVTESLMATRIGGPALALNPHWSRDIVTRMLASRGLTFQPTEFHARVDHAAEQARALIRARLQGSQSR